MPNKYAEMARKFYFSIPMLIAVPIIYWFIFQYAGVSMNWAAFGIGAAGWTVALFLRNPVALLAKAFAKKHAKTIVVASSGPLEEGVRVVVLLLSGMSFRWAASVGQGWAAVEVLFTIINGIVLMSLVQRTDEKAQQIKALLEEQGASNQGAWWAVVIERTFANAFHIGSTLIIAWNPWLAVVMIPSHTILNLASIRLAKHSIILTELLIASMGAAALVIGLVLF